MSLRNFHVDANVTDDSLMQRAKGLWRNIVGSFRQAVANGHFKFGFLTLQNPDLNRLHGIVTEIDTRRVFFNCSDDEIPKWAMKSLYDAREEIRKSSKGVWADPSCEVLVQEITDALNEFSTHAEKLDPEHLSVSSDNYRAFFDLVAGMRLRVWSVVAAIKVKVGSIIQPKHLPPELLDMVSEEGV